MQATGRPISRIDEFTAKYKHLTENVKRKSWRENTEAYSNSVKELDAKLLLQFHAITHTKAAIFLLAPKHKREKTDCYNVLIGHLLGEERENLETVTEFMNARITDDDNQDKFKNGVLHDLIINECWHETMELIEACANNGIEINEGITRGDANGRRPLEIALMMDVAPLEVLKLLTTLHQQAIADAVENRLELLNILSIAYKQQNSDFLHWLGTENPGLYEELMNHIDESGVRVHREDEYRHMLHQVCVYADRSVNADRNYLVLDVGGADACIKWVNSKQFMVCAKDESSKILPKFFVEDRRAKNLTWLDARQLPWEPQVQEGHTSKILASTEENIKQLFFLIKNPDKALWDPTYFQVGTQEQVNTLQQALVNKLKQALDSKLKEYVGKENFEEFRERSNELAAGGKRPALEHIKKTSESLSSRFFQRRTSSIRNSGTIDNGKKGHCHDRYGGLPPHWAKALRLDDENPGASNDWTEEEREIIKRHTGNFIKRTPEEGEGYTNLFTDRQSDNMEFEKGSRVMLEGLHSRKDLNGAIGTVIRKARGGERYIVQTETENGQEEFRVRPSNIKILQKGHGSKNSLKI